MPGEPEEPEFVEGSILRAFVVGGSVRTGEKGLDAELAETPALSDFVVFVLGAVGWRVAGFDYCFWSADC